MNDLKATWEVCLIVFFLSFAISIIFLLLLRLCAGVIAWSMIVLYHLLLFTLAAFCLYNANNPDESLPSSLRNEDLLQAMGYIFLILGIFSLLLLACFWNKVKKAVAILKAAAMFTV